MDLIQLQFVFTGISYLVYISIFGYILKFFIKDRYNFIASLIGLFIVSMLFITSMDTMLKIESFFPKYYEFPKLMDFIQYNYVVTIVLFKMYFKFLNIVSVVGYFSFVYVVFYFTNNFMKNTKSQVKYFQILQPIFEISFILVSFGTYLIILLISFLRSNQMMGTRRILVEGNEIIRNSFFAQIRLYYEMAVRNQEGFRFFKNLRLPRNLEVLNILIVGAMGSGKTVFLTPIILQFFERRSRSLIIDNKMDYCELIGERHGVVILSPFDSRSPVWNIAEDIVTELEAIEFVSVLIPTKGGSGDFFALAARDIALGAIKYLQAIKPFEWNMVEILETVASEELLTILKTYHAGALQTLRDCGIDEKTGKMFVGETASGIFAQIRANLQSFEILAKAWPITKDGFSVRRWARGEDENTLFVIVPFMQIYPNISGFFSSIVIDIFINETLNLPDSKERRVGLFLDELGAVPRIKSLANATKMFRSKGGCIFVGIQEVGVVRSKYQEDGGTESILNGFSIKLIGRAETSEYAEYFVKSFGKNKYKKITRSRSMDSYGKRSTSTSEEIVIEATINSGELLCIPPASLKTGAYFYLKMSEIPVIFKLKWPIIPVPRPYKGNIEPDWLRRPIKPKVTQIQLKNDVIKVQTNSENVKEEKIIPVDHLQVQTQDLSNTILEKKVEEDSIKTVSNSTEQVLDETKIESKVNPSIQNPVSNLKNKRPAITADLSVLNSTPNSIKNMINEQKIEPIQENKNLNLTTKIETEIQAKIEEHKESHEEEFEADLSGLEAH